MKLFEVIHARWRGHNSLIWENDEILVQWVVSSSALLSLSPVVKIVVRELKKLGVDVPGIPSKHWILWRIVDNRQAKDPSMASGIGWAYGNGGGIQVSLGK